MPWKQTKKRGRHHVGYSHRWFQADWWLPSSLEWGKLILALQHMQLSGAGSDAQRIAWAIGWTGWWVVQSRGRDCKGEVHVQQGGSCGQLQKPQPMCIIT